MNVRHAFRQTAEVDDRLKDILAPLFVAWVRNKMVPTYLMLQTPEIKRPPERISAAIQTIHELCGHFCYDDDDQPYFFHLISILKKFPDVTDADCRRGMHDIAMILKSFGVVPQREAPAGGS